MPFYEYQCKNCGHELEAMQKISEDPLKKCPHCGKSKLQRLISAPVFRLKGGGWYETDFKNDKDKKRNLADGPDSEGGKDTDSKKADATETKSDTKPAEKEAPAKPKEPAATVDKASASSKTNKMKKRVVKPVAKKTAKSKAKKR